jgi:hypothetical protein
MTDVQHVTRPRRQLAPRAATDGVQEARRCPRGYGSRMLQKAEAG